MRLALTRLFHYTNEEGLRGILTSWSLNPFLVALNPADTRYGDGQYFSDYVPGSKSLGDLSRAFLGFPFQDRRFSHFVEVHMTDLDVVSGREGVFVVLNSSPLDMKDNPMHYVSVEWLQSDPNEPIRLYYELDADRYERRKVEEYRNGILHSASTAHGQGTTFLAWEPHPPLIEIEADPQFRACEITAPEFERVWLRARQGELQPAASYAR